MGSIWTPEVFIKVTPYLLILTTPYSVLFAIFATSSGLGIARDIYCIRSRYTILYITCIYTDGLPTEYGLQRLIQHC